jgi:hypothetical protein
VTDSVRPLPLSVNANPPWSDILRLESERPSCFAVTPPGHLPRTIDTPGGNFTVTLLRFGAFLPAVTMNASFGPLRESTIRRDGVEALDDPGALPKTPEPPAAPEPVPGPEPPRGPVAEPPATS